MSWARSASCYTSFALSSSCGENRRLPSETLRQVSRCGGFCPSSPAARHGRDFSCAQSCRSRTKVIPFFSLPCLSSLTHAGGPAAAGGGAGLHVDAVAAGLVAGQAAPGVAAAVSLAEMLRTVMQEGLAKRDPTVVSFSKASVQQRRTQIGGGANVCDCLRCSWGGRGRARGIAESRVDVDWLVVKPQPDRYQ